MTDPERPHTVEIAAVTGPARVGESVTVTVTAEAETEGELSVNLTAGGEQVESESVAVDAGGTGRTEFEWTPGTDAVGTVEVVASTATASATGSLTVEEAPPKFTVELDTADESIPVGGTVTVIAEITNEGTLPGTQSVALRAGETVSATRSLGLDGGESETVEFDYEVTEGDGDEVTLTVATEDDEAEMSVSVVDRTVTPRRAVGSKSGMGVFGWLILAGMAILLAPLLPLVAVLKLIDTLRSGPDR